MQLSHSFILYSVLEEELTEGLVEPVPAIVESESIYVATFETVQDDLNTSTVYSIDSMGDIGENQFNSCTNSCIVFDKPCNSFDGVSKSLIPPIFDTLSSQPTLQNDPVYLTRESPENSNISFSIFSSSPQLPLSSTVTPGISKFPDNTELACVVCNEVCSDAHHCPGCYRAIHAICGEAVDGMEGYGCPVWCVSCLLEKRNNTIQEGRRADKRGQQEQIDRMKQQSNKKLQVFGIGENVLLPIPQVDKRSPFDPQNLPGVILNCTDQGLYQIGTAAGRLEDQYTGGQLEVSLINRRMPNCTTVVQTASDLFEHEIRLNLPKK